MSVFDRITARAKEADMSALYALHPELTYRQHLISLTDDEMGAISLAGGYDQARRDYAGHVWVHKAVSVIANAVAPLPLQVLDASGEARPAHPLAALFNRPNDSMSSSDVWRQWVTDQLLGGEVGLEVVAGSRGGVVELWPRQPTQFSVITDAARKRYYGVAGYRIKFDALDRGFELPPDEFVHFKFYNPVNPWRGLAPIEAVRMGVVIDQLAQAWSRLFFRNSARPDYAIVAPQGITLSEREQLETQLMAKFGGVGNAHKPIILEDGVTDIKTFSHRPKDIEWLAQREMSRDEIGAIFGVPDEIMGYGRDTYENFETARGVLWTLTLLPLLGYRDTTLTAFFRRRGELAAGERIATDTSSVSELQEDLTEKLSQAKLLFEMGYAPDQINERLGLGMDSLKTELTVQPSQAAAQEPPKPDIFGYHIELGVVSRNEARASLGLEPIESAEVDRLNRLAQILGVLRAALDARIAPDDALRLVGLTDVEIIDLASNAGPFGAPPRAVRPIRTKQAVPAYGSAEHTARMKALDERQEPHVETMQRGLKREFQRQQNEALRALRNSRALGRGQLKHLDKDELEAAVKQSAADLFDLTSEVDRFIDAFRDDVEQMLDDAATAEYARLDNGHLAPFDIERPEVQRAIDETLREMAHKTNNTTFEGLIDLIQEAEADGESIPEIAERISAYFGGRKSDFETERIARTTMVGADNRGALEAYSQSGVVSTVTWLAAIDDRTREAHIEAHGQTRKLGESFEVGGEQLRHPGDPQGNPENVINCRCGVEPGVEA